ncbi:ABC transporter substrate-binding protein [Hoyosella subflava]|uniref:Amino acid ABC transporter substrate-binding protein, PAAT family (TC 3.A.1.3.-) n=1 Tax=Hoyosella subflava (strain DSM 45089 / JCM 17490 / NBRC 109087 / DQS3-9A1) TaxID=443218 RepID=F6EKX7_HOYSD|nr:ABC transporter substrate-binding protein [Hoyosella subflava]AEF41457.1 Amino acid ABC transporter substrate-binding protein, PAAT family (TC 3.A.1.3.-) [Hoyosella subflava DQS3-9A1]
MKRPTKVQAAAAGVALLMTLSACGAGESASTDGSASKTSKTSDISEGVQPDPAAVALLPDSYKDKGSITVAMDLFYPPTTFLAEDNTTPIGLNPDVARLVAKKLGLELKFVNTSFDTIIPGIAGGRYDFTATSMSPTSERLEVLDMIDYFDAGVSVAVAAGNPLNMANDDLCGRNIAVTKGSNAQLRHLPNVSEWTCESQDKPAIKSVVLPNVQDALTQLAAKRVDGVFYDTPALVWADEQQPNTFTILTPQVDTRSDHIVTVALKKGSPLTPALQAAVQSVLDSPEYLSSLEYWGLTDGRIAEAKLN